MSETPKKSTKSEPPRKKIRSITDTLLKYEGVGWSATHLASKAQMDIFATKGEGNKQRVHFVKVIDKDIMKEPSIEETNQYIQNAFSNNAEPIFAYVYYKENKLDKIILEDINSGKNLRLIADKKTEAVDKQENVVISPEKSATKQEKSPVKQEKKTPVKKATTSTK